MRKKTTYDILIVALFMAVLCIPGLIMLARIPQGQSVFAPKPVFRSDAVDGLLQPVMAIPTPISPPVTSRLSRWLRPFDAWTGAQSRNLQDFSKNFTENLAGRDKVLPLHAHLMTQLFKSSPNRSVMLGKQNWLFYTGNSSTEGYRGIRPLTAAELGNLKYQFEKRRDFLAKRGIAYLIILVPDKQTVYPEFMPDHMTRLGPSRIEQVFTYLKAKTNLQLLNLTSSLIASKSRGELYFPTDTHWNWLGSFIAYQQISRELRHIFPRLQPLQIEDCIQTPIQSIGGDLTMMLGTQQQESQSLLVIKPKRQNAKNMSSRSWGYNQRDVEEKGLTFTESPQGEIRRAVIFHDSFFNTLTPFIASHFQRAVYVWSLYHDEAIIDREKPDIVIDELVERFCVGLAGRPDNINNF